MLNIMIFFLYFLFYIIICHVPTNCCQKKFVHKPQTVLQIRIRFSETDLEVKNVTDPEPIFKENINVYRGRRDERLLFREEQRVPGVEVGGDREEPGAWILFLCWTYTHGAEFSYFLRRQIHWIEPNTLWKMSYYLYTSWWHVFKDI